MKELENVFNKYRKDEDYVQLGWFFWNGFATYDGDEKNLLRKLWDSLSKKEKRLCENV